MGAVAVRREVHDAIVERGPRHAIEFFHGYTYSAHPAACAAGLAALGIFERERAIERAAALSPHFQERLFSLRELPAVADVRGYGLLGGVDLAPVEGAPGLAGHEAQKRLFDAGLHVKATGDALLFAPAFVCSPADVDAMIAITRDVLAERRR
jgi:beta-alanine--pyruvate transaminase